MLIEASPKFNITSGDFSQTPFPHIVTNIVEGHYIVQRSASVKVSFNNVP